MADVGAPQREVEFEPVEAPVPVPVPRREPVPANVLERFFAKVERQDNGCWLWTASQKREGYGQFRYQRRMVTSHRISYLIAHGTMPPADREIDHLCRVRACVNPDHLEVVTKRENVMRGVGPTAQNASKVACLRGHDFDEANTYMRGGSRQCRECNKAAVRRYKERQADPASPASARQEPAA